MSRRRDRQRKRQIIGKEKDREREIILKYERAVREGIEFIRSK